MTPTDSRDHSAHVSALGIRVHDALAELVKESYPDNLYAPIKYVLSAGGKRLRPVLALLSAEIFGVPAERAMPAALAVEVFHNFTLVHDDIMDEADERRGRPTVHVRWDQSDAILAGDLMMGLSYELLSQLSVADLAPVFRTFNRMVVRLCEGQALDKQFETRDQVSLDEYLVMIEGKTAALIETSLVLGGQIAAVDRPTLDRLTRIGRAIGRAFQIQDDLLDLTATDEAWGKRIGGDLIVGKKTYLLLKTLERADAEDRSWFGRIISDGGLAESEVPEARDRMERLGVLDDTREMLSQLYGIAEDELGLLPKEPAVGTIRWLIGRMASRVH